MELVTFIQTVNYTLAVIFFLCYSYQLFYVPISHLKKDRPHAPVKMHKYAVLICARNESAVIAQLIQSIRNQDYPSKLVTIFVAADNCTDDTARIARENGAIVYERFNREYVGKGYAMQFLLDHIVRDYGEDTFDGYFVFDADNVLKHDYISRMNETFSDGYNITTSYRNSKNYGDNWISAGYGLWFLRESQYLNHARMLLGASCAVSGTGFLFSREVLKHYGGWKFFLLTEDIEFSVANIIRGETIGYCKDAVLYDEQPINFRQSCRQRMRWAKGYLQVFRKYGFQLFCGIFGKNGFSCFDMCMNIMPAMVLSIFSVLFNVTALILTLIKGTGLGIATFSVIQSLVNGSLLILVLGFITTLTQWKHIHTTTGKKLLYALTFPIFMFTYLPITAVTLFRKVEWKPISHNVHVSVEDLSGVTLPMRKKASAFKLRAK
jgi:cellulose synthase/poly-beta-1,6-N-acetylglucosamine synthase-like glycosyltransferase